MTTPPMPSPSASDAEVENWFTYHPPTPDQVPSYEAVRSYGRAMAEGLLVLCPPSRERSLALTALRESVMWANAAIACNPAPDAVPVAPETAVFESTLPALPPGEIDARDHIETWRAKAAADGWVPDGHPTGRQDNADGSVTVRGPVRRR